WDMHVEVVTNVTPGYNDDPAEIEQMAQWISSNLGKETPWHLTRFHPHLYLTHIPPTPIKTLERFREIGFNHGLLYVYLGNVPGHEGENTYCYNCNRLLIKRHIFDITKNEIKNGYCPYCKVKIHGKFLKDYAAHS
ncbi:MAG: AmmeMemoRadiSam system radical SAM enzyme, partial [Fidelibacterota bacterium]